MSFAIAAARSGSSVRFLGKTFYGRPGADGGTYVAATCQQLHSGDNQRRRVTAREFTGERLRSPPDVINTSATLGFGGLAIND
jgi:hypothetical protein